MEVGEDEPIVIESNERLVYKYLLANVSYAFQEATKLPTVGSFYRISALNRCMSIVRQMD